MMFAVIGCIIYENNPALVVLAALVCLFGSVVFLRLVQRGTNSHGSQKVGWHFLAAVAGGGGVWATHFVAMLAFEPQVPVVFDPILTVLSLVVAMLGLFASLLISGTKTSRIAPAISGAFCGLSFAAMHYTGMFAYRVVGLVEWRFEYIVSSVLVAAVFSALAFGLLWYSRRASYFWGGVAAMVIAIVGLHFTGMTAFRVTPMAGVVPNLDPQAVTALALGIAVVAFIVVGTGFASYLIDTRVRADTKAQFYHMAAHDPLTGLPNRSSCLDYLDQVHVQSIRAKTRFSVIAIDLDRFKEVNDTLGHAAGDEVLKTLAHRLKQTLRDDEFVARIGGDEFAAILPYADHDEVHQFAHRLCSLFSLPMKIGTVNTSVGASLGIAVWPDDASIPEELLENADLAMYHAKHTSPESICFYDAEIALEVRERRQMADALKTALEENELELYYQVQMTLEKPSGTINGCEALLRWTHPRLGVVSPAVFVPVAEQNGLIGPLGEWVFRRACADAAAWDTPHRVAVNVSPVQFMDGNLPRLLHEVLLDTGLAPERLELELTEAAIIHNPTRSLQIMRQIKLLGIGVALDHFGSGFFSLETLQTFPFDRIKLDKAFVDRIGHDRQSKAIFRAVLTLGESLGIPVLAEGIETTDQMELLRRENCTEGQGYLFGHPLPCSDAEGPQTQNLKVAHAGGREPSSLLSPVAERLGKQGISLVDVSRK
ncbi:putative bifunctional diguanylate cyclase/phosphodiesterase [Roseibium limicola]|uniref:putative bifunctional diguanylate cyclase/phosphodiesterase n=1 Tax=Roseibium limicola TaxID=2816037 RepID=UPI002F41FA33